MPRGSKLRGVLTGTVATVLVLGALATAAGASASDRHGADAHAGHERSAAVQHQLVDAQRATAGYHRVAAAESDGYARPPEGVPLHACISGHDGDGSMGIHWINGEQVGDAVLDPARPEVLVYEPTKSGRLRLVALEYVVFADVWQAEHPGTVPLLFGRPLTLVPEPNPYELPAFYQVHAWIWQHNPHGTFADHNPRVSCGFASAVP